MQSGTRRLLTGATLMLLAAACAAGLGASKAAAASQHGATVVKKISACGYVATKAGTYELTQSVTDSGSGDCINLTASNITLYLDSHTITGTSTDTCVGVGGNGTTSVKDTVIGGKMTKPGASKKAKKQAAKPAKLTNCDTGVQIGLTSGTTASNLNVVAPAGVGVVAVLATGANLSHINVPMHVGNSANGFILLGGADNVVSNSTVNYDGSADGFSTEQETGDTFMRDTVNNPYTNGTDVGTGFLNEESSRDTWSHCSSSGQYNGFDFASNGYGPVTATYDTATGSPANSGSIGFEITNAFQEADSSSPFHTLLSHNKATGFQDGFDDANGGAPGPIAETWMDNTADNYSAVGFLINSPADYTITGNIADANTSAKKYTGGDSYGFALVNASAAYPPARFANNQAYDGEYGFYSSATAVGGKGNIAKRNKYNSYGVEITG